MTAGLGFKRLAESAERRLLFVFVNLLEVGIDHVVIGGSRRATGTGTRPRSLAARTFTLGGLLVNGLGEFVRRLG